jgi:P27 family predicted phage terminase small subunit
MKKKRPNQTPKPPRHLSASTRKWFTSIVTEFVLEDFHLRLLELCCVAWDRAQSARQAIKRHGLTYRAPNGDIRPRPEVNIEKNAMVVFARLLRELALDVPPPGAEVRMPRLAGTGA